MTESADLDVINEALQLVDKGLSEMQHRELVSTAEVADLLLDVRLLLSTAGPDTADEDLPVPVG